MHIHTYILLAHLSIYFLIILLLTSIHFLKSRTKQNRQKVNRLNIIISKSKTGMQECLFCCDPWFILQMCYGKIPFNQATGTIIYLGRDTQQFLMQNMSQSLRDRTCLELCPLTNDPNVFVDVWCVCHHTQMLSLLRMINSCC